MSNSITSFTELNVWISARKLSNDIYSISREFPRQEQFGLTNQMRRCVVSVSSNIAEGCGRNYPKDSIQFFFIARGSIYELESQLYLAYDLGYIKEKRLNELLTYIETSRKLLNGFIKYYQTLAGPQYAPRTGKF